MMSETGPELGLRDEDRLPWLEAVESDDDGEGVSSGKLIAFMLAGLAAIGLVVGGVWWLRSQEAEPQGDGTLIAAPQGDYKVKPEAPGGMKVEGQGDSAFAASEGAEANGKVDTAAQPEVPVVVQKPAAVPPKPAIVAKRAVTTPMPPSGGKLVPPVAAGTWIQLGAYNSEATADNAWRALAAKTPALAKLPKSVVTASVGGKTYYRLRANAGSLANATALCGRVGNCMVVR